MGALVPRMRDRGTQASSYPNSTVIIHRAIVTIQCDFICQSAWHMLKEIQQNAGSEHEAALCPGSR